MSSTHPIAFADQFKLGFDMRFHFVMPVPVQPPESATSFLGFTPDVLDLIGCLRKLLYLPQHPGEISESKDRVIARRMGGTTFQFFPIPLIALPRLVFDLRTPLLCFVSNLHTYSDIAEYIKTISFPTLHLSTNEGSDVVSLSEVSIDTLYRFCEKIRAFHEEHRNSKIVAELDRLSIRPRNWVPTPLEISKSAHLVVLPNELALESLGYEFQSESSLIPHKNEFYIKAICDSADAILNERKRILTEIGTPAPAPLTVILTSPGFFKHNYGGVRLPLDENRDAIGLFKHLVTQKDYFLNLPPQVALASVQDVATGLVLYSYKKEIEAYSLCVAVKAASHFAPSLRLPPSVNHLHSIFDSFARNARGDSPHYAFKQNRLMRELKKKIAELVPSSFVERLDRKSNVIKIISDAPLEWLPIRGLPMMLRYNTSRIPTTPGNLLFNLSLSSGELTVTAEYLQNVLVVTSFADQDRLKGLLPSVLKLFPTERLRLTMVEVKTKEELVAAFQSFRGGIAIFDGHGSPSIKGRPGTIALNGHPVDIWELRKEFKPPPIVFLSACDTHAIDGAHASVANAFLLLGATTVIGTTLPIEAKMASVFIGRFLYRLNDFLPMLVEHSNQPVRWIKFMAGLQRMSYVTELFLFLRKEGLLVMSEEEEKKLATEVNWPVVKDVPAWYEEIIGIFSRSVSRNPNDLLQLIDAKFNLPECLKYVQLGNPEQILLVDRENERRIFGKGS